jgi:ABC-type amino acid transport system permease subunit
LFVVLGAVLAVFARRFTLWSLRPYFSKQRLAELDQPGQRRLRMFVNFSRGTGVLIGLFFVVTGIVSLLK